MCKCVNRLTSRCCSTTNTWCQRWSTQPKSVGYRSWTAKRVQLVKGRASCHKMSLQIYKQQSYPKEDLLCVQLASYLEKGPLMWKMQVNQNPMMMMMMMMMMIISTFVTSSCKRLKHNLQHYNPYNPSILYV